MKGATDDADARHHRYRLEGPEHPGREGCQAEARRHQEQSVVYGRKVGRAGEYEASTVEATTAYERGQSVKALYTQEEGELQVLCDTGQTFVWPDAFLTDNRELTGGEGGKVALKWAGGDYEEIVT